MGGLEPISCILSPLPTVLCLPGSLSWVRATFWGGCCVPQHSTATQETICLLGHEGTLLSHGECPPALLGASPPSCSPAGKLLAHAAARSLAVLPPPRFAHCHRGPVLVPGWLWSLSQEHAAHLSLSHRRLLPRSAGRLGWSRSPRMWWTTTRTTSPSSSLPWG